MWTDLDIAVCSCFTYMILSDYHNLRWKTTAVQLIVINNYIAVNLGMVFFYWDPCWMSLTTFTFSRQLPFVRISDPYFVRSTLPILCVGVIWASKGDNEHSYQKLYHWVICLTTIKQNTGKPEFHNMVVKPRKIYVKPFLGGNIRTNKATRDLIFLHKQSHHS